MYTKQTIESHLIIFFITAKLGLSVGRFDGARDRVSTGVRGWITAGVARGCVRIYPFKFFIQKAIMRQASRIKHFRR